MSVTRSVASYVLGNTDTEHERLIWQAERVGPTTERLFREAGIGTGQRVLDIGSGVGDVAMLIARLVGPSGEVVGVERDEKSMARAQSRVAHTGFRNVTFHRTDVSQIPVGQLFDAVVGRFILMFLPDPAAILRVLARLVRPGGVVAFQEPAWAPAMTLMAPLPLWSAVARMLYETFLRSGARPELGAGLYQVFEDAGLPGPIMRAEMVMGKHSDISHWYADLFATLRPEMQKFGVPYESAGDLETLRERLQAETDASKSAVALPAFVGAWVRKPVA